LCNLPRVIGQDMTPTLLIVDDEKTTREGLRAALEDRYDVYLAEDARSAMELLEKEHFDVLLTDFRLPSEDGMKLIARAKSLSKPPICILMTAYGSEELAVEAMKRGADDYIAKGRLQIDELEMRIARALRQQNLEVENVALRQQLDAKFGMEGVVGESAAMREVFEVVQQVAPTRALEARFEVFRRHGVRPALVVDYPVATREESAGIIRRLAAEGCEVGVHLHPWSAPPVVEPKDDWHSFSGNLGPDLERIKLAALTEAVTRLLGRPPSLFKAGRYGLSPDTVAALGALGFAIDLSICPGYDYTAMGGPDFSRFTARPGWFGGSRPILSLPTTAGHVGWLSGRAATLGRLARSAAGRALRFERLAARANALYPLRLSPEGATLAEMRDLTRRLLGRGLRVFTLTLHSPTLAPGNTPYTRTEADLVALLERIDRYLAFFRDELGGQFTTPSALHARLSALRPPGSARPDA